MRFLRVSRAVGFAALFAIAACNGSIGGPAGSRGGGEGPVPNGVETPGRTPLRRLTNAQYNETIHTLLGIDGDYAQTFGPDEEVGGFASNVTVPVSATLVEKYRETAERLAEQAVTAGLARLAPCAPPKSTADACANQFIPDFGKRAFRRPLSPEEVDRYQAVYAAGSGDFVTGIKLVISAMLQSPYFLYLPEVGEPAGAGNTVPLTPYEVASRLSYFLLRTMPDDELFLAADNRKLTTTSEIAAQALRLLGTSQGSDAVVSFHREWLMLDNILSTAKDATAYPDFTPAVRQAMNDEVSAFVNAVLRDGDARLETLLSANFSFIQGPLYDLYGLPLPTTGATTPKRVEFPAGQRAGLLTLAGTLATFAHPDQSSPVARGLLVSEKLLCVTPGLPPPDVDTTVPPPDPNVTTRQRLESHRNSPTCNACHGLMDPYGLTFENYDGIGRYRTKDGIQPVDATETLSEIGPVKNAVDLMEHLASSDQVRRCVVQHWFRHALGRVEAETDAATLSLVLAAFARADYRIPDLLVAMASSDGFRYRSPIVQ